MMAVDSPAAVSFPPDSPSVSSLPVEIAFVDAAVARSDQLISLARPGIEFVQVDNRTDPIVQLTEAISRRNNIQAIHVISHGQTGQLLLGGQLIDSAALQTNTALLQQWGSSLRADADLLIYGCEVAAGPVGEHFLRAWSALTAADVAGSANRTGSLANGGDWQFESIVGQVNAESFADVGDLNLIDVLLPIEIHAASEVGGANMDLLIDGVVVQSWTDIDGNPELGQFNIYTYNGGDGVTADQVRVAYTNDFWDPIGEIDRNLDVDKVVINGRTFETEHPSVSSTGTYVASAGTIVAGNWQSETLHSNGYFQYAEIAAAPTDDTITIYAASLAGNARMQLLIDGVAVKTWNGIAGDPDQGQFSAYTYSGGSGTSADQIRVAFLNNGDDPVTGIDRNLDIDRIEINGQVFETEDPSVYSTGTYDPSAGDIVPGYRQSQTLHANGYFQYAIPPAGVAAISLADITVDEGAGTINVTATLDRAVPGGVTADVVLTPDTATAADYRAVTNSITFIGAAGETVSISVEIIDDALPESNENLTVALTNVVGAGTIDGSDAATLTITDNDSATTITIYAASRVGNAQMELLIDGVVEQTWDGIAGNPELRQFQTFTSTLAGIVTADQIRIGFTNDFYDAANGVDRNLDIDKIEINGTVFETEDPSVFSTGTYVESAGTIVPGNWLSETLHSEGYFQYTEAGNPPTGDTVTIHAASQVGGAQMQLLIDGVVVKTWNDIAGNPELRQFQTFTYTGPGPLTADQVRVAFTNDLWDPVAGIDRNLDVDKIEINGTVFETEAPNVFSTGTFVVAAEAVLPGFWQLETLHSEGYFQFSAAEPDPGKFQLETSVITVSEGAPQATVQVLRTGGSDGLVTVDFTTQAASATPGQDYTSVSQTLVFADGVTSQTAIVPLLDDGLVEPNEQFNITIDNPSGGAGLLAPRTATVTIVDDETPLPDYPDFASTDGLTLSGSANQIDSSLAISGALPQQVGSAFFSSALSLADDGSFRSRFAFRIDGGTAGGEGLTFTIQNDPRGASAIGLGDGGLGYEGIANSVSVEFDTLVNGVLDPDDNHIAILQGSTQTILNSASPAFELNSGATYHAWIDYNGISDSLAVYFSNSAVKPAYALLKTTVDLQASIGERAYFGFTSSTGPVANQHRVEQWSLDLLPPAQDPPTQQLDSFVATELVTGLGLPTAIDWLPDGTMIIAEKAGLVITAVDGTINPTPFIDISPMVNNVFDRGLLSMTTHPDFANHPYVYLLFTYDPPEVNDHPGNPLAGPDGEGNRAGRLIRVTADPDNDYLTAIPGSEVVLLGTNSTWENFNGFVNSTYDFTEPPAGENPDGSYLQDFIPTDSESHSVGDLAWGIDGSLFVSTGDGASFNQVDVRADRVQHIDSLSGKVLRIDPITGLGLPDNPFYQGDPTANRSKVYQLGLRNPFRLSVDSQTGQLYIGEVGWGNWEEINAAGPGANFGWPFYEGGSNGENLVNFLYAETPEGQAFFAQDIPVIPPVYALHHLSDGIDAIVVGALYSGSLYGSEYQGDLFFNDLGQGLVRRLSFDAQGNAIQLSAFATGAEIVVAIKEGPDGALYYVDLDDGAIGRWDILA